MSDRFYTEQPLSPGEFALDGPEAHHLATVRRFEIGDVVTLFNGDGAEYPAEILSVGKKQVALLVRGRLEISRELPNEVVIGSSLPKADRFDFLLEKLVEHGAARFVPLISERSVNRPKADKLDKMRRAVIEASKQCGRNKLMTIDNPLSLEAFLATASRTSAKWILHTGGRTPSPAVSDAENGGIFAVGPEGGFTDAEVARACESGWQTLSFGPRILRTETAAVAAIAWAANRQLTRGDDRRE